MRLWFTLGLYGPWCILVLMANGNGGCSCHVSVEDRCAIVQSGNWKCKYTSVKLLFIVPFAYLWAGMFRVISLTSTALKDVMTAIKSSWNLRLSS